MQDDIADAAQWAIKQGLTDKDRAAIYGASFGGLRHALRPGVQAQAVRMWRGRREPSNIRTMLKTFPIHCEVIKKLIDMRIRPATTDNAFNERISPLFHEHKIVKPLLIAQGVSDPRVKQAEADQIAKKHYKHKHNVQYVLYSDEGHGFARPANNIDFDGRLRRRCRFVSLPLFAFASGSPWVTVVGIFCPTGM